MSCRIPVCDSKEDSIVLSSPMSLSSPFGLLRSDESVESIWSEACKARR
jgi:hypothetical protein